MWTNPITGKFDLVRLILTVYAVVFLLRFLAGGLQLTFSSWSYAVEAPTIADLVALLGWMASYLYKRTVDQRASRSGKGGDAQG